MGAPRRNRIPDLGKRACADRNSGREPGAGCPRRPHSGLAVDRRTEDPGAGGLVGGLLAGARPRPVHTGVGSHGQVRALRRRRVGGAGSSAFAALPADHRGQLLSAGRVEGRSGRTLAVHARDGALDGAHRQLSGGPPVRSVPVDAARARLPGRPAGAVPVLASHAGGVQRGAGTGGAGDQGSRRRRSPRRCPLRQDPKPPAARDPGTSCRSTSPPCVSRAIPRPSG